LPFVLAARKNKRAFVIA